MPIPAWWLKECRDWISNNNLSMGEVGRQLARAMGRPKAYTHSTVSRYLSGDVTSPDVTEAFARLRRTASPVMLAESREDIDWLQLGQELRRLNPAAFAAYLNNLRLLVDAERRR